jgi:FlaA1/EpsC-like NDP-sugar epimerase
MEKPLKGKRVFVTGACGTIGRELVRQLLADHDVEELIGIDNNESELFFLEQHLSRYGNARFFLADVRDSKKLSRLMKHIEVVFHTAAFKHVILCERSPFEAIQTNINGVQNVISASNENAVERVVFTSSDKAVNPTNVMGTSKLMGERLMTAANSNKRNSGPLFVSTRFGNVLGSRGSVIPIFREQIKKGGPVTLTDPDMTRFIMSIEEAVRLVIDSAALACGGEVLITKMPIIRIQDLADIMVQELSSRFGHKPENIVIKNIGVKPGEKMYEELMNIEETRRTWELPGYFVVMPAYGNIYHEIQYQYPDIVSKDVSNPYNSQNEEPLTKANLKNLLKKTGLLYENTVTEHPSERYWP